MLQLLAFSAQGLSELAAPLSGSVHCVSSVLLRRFLPSCFNKLPYVSICSTTEESELTFQSAGPCALWIHRPRISTSTSFITLNDWLTDWRPSVITPKRPPLLLSLLSSTPSQQSPSSWPTNSSLASSPFADLLSLLLQEVPGTWPFQSKKQQTRLSCRGVNRFLCWMP